MTFLSSFVAINAVLGKIRRRVCSRKNRGERAARAVMWPSYTRGRWCPDAEISNCGSPVLDHEVDRAIANLPRRRLGRKSTGSDDDFLGMGMTTVCHRISLADGVKIKARRDQDS